MTPQRPYLLRAMHEWMTDNGQTPHVVVDVSVPGVDVPAEFVRDGKIILNVGYAAVRDLALGNDELAFEARFSGRPRRVRVPVAAVMGIYARETGRGMVFSAEEGLDEAATPDGEGREPAESGGVGRRPELKVVK